MQPSTVPTRIVCVGNELACDDGIGIRVGRVLERLPLPASAEVVLAAEVGLDLIEVVLAAHRLILVDATHTGQPPGTVQVMTEGAVSALAQLPCSSHAVGLPELLVLAARLEPHREPAQVALVGVEAAVLDRFGTELSPAVQTALPTAVAQVLELLGAAAELIALGREHAARFAAWEPAALEALGG